ncbi:MAG: hypothetical protein AAFP19_18175 [Bacteroidota bacterium]
MKTIISIGMALFILSLLSCRPELIPALQEKQQLHATTAWESLSSYPQKVGRTDDLSFVNTELGWAVNSQGVLLKTRDGGDNWIVQFRKKNSFFRAVVFKDSLNGWLGTLGRNDSYLYSTDSIILYETHDGGESWAPTAIEGPYPTGICGMQKVNDQSIVACGRVRGPSYFMKTNDGGETWQSFNLDHVAGSLIAPYFFDEQHGILVGGTTRDKNNSKALVLETYDGGQSWDTIYQSQQKGEYCWKISFPSKEIGYISVQRNLRDGRFYCLKSTDGGRTWMEKDFAKKRYLAQGIGFINEQVGWIGGSFKYSYETRDGGDTWLPVSNAGKGLNNFQFIDQQRAFSVGRGIYRLDNLDPLLNGEVLSHYPNGQIQSRKNYQQGILNGPFQSYYPDGQLEQRGKYKRNLRHGKWDFYSPEGQKTTRIKYRHDIAKIATDQLEDFVGIYRVKEDTYRFITLEKGQLYSTRSDTQEKLIMYPETDHQFFYRFDVEVKIMFVRDEKGAVSHTISYQPGGETKAERIGEEEAAALWSLYQPKPKKRGNR